MVPSYVASSDTSLIAANDYAAIPHRTVGIAQVHPVVEARQMVRHGELGKLAAVVRVDHSHQLSLPSADRRHLQVNRSAAAGVGHVFRIDLRPAIHISP
jgi:hypothetical protein